MTKKYKLYIPGNKPVQIKPTFSGETLMNHRIKTTINFNVYDFSEQIEKLNKNIEKLIKLISGKTEGALSLSEEKAGEGSLSTSEK